MELSAPSMTTRPYYTFPYIVTSAVNFILVVLLAVWNPVEKVQVLASMSVPPDDKSFLTDTSSVNVPWPTKGMTDADYIHTFQQIVMPIALEFAPELVISMFRKRFFVGTFTT